MGLPGARGPIGPRVRDTYELHWSSIISPSDFSSYIFCIFNFRVYPGIKGKRYETVCYYHLIRNAMRYIDYLQHLKWGNTVPSSSSGFSRWSRGKRSERRQGRKSLSVTGILSNKQSVTMLLCCCKVVLRCALLHLQGAMGFPGMLGQKVRMLNLSSRTKTFQIWPNWMLSCLVWCAGGNGPKRGTWDLREQRTHWPTREERQAGEESVVMWHSLCVVLKQQYMELHPHPQWENMSLTFVIVFL